MKLTGKCKEDFDKWYKNTYYKNSIPTIQNLQILVFDSLQDNKKYGVYVDFFDSVGMTVECSRIKECDNNIFYVTQAFDIDYKTRNEARIKSVEMANKIYNEKS